MKRFLKSAIAIVMTLLFAFGGTMSAFAAEVAPEGTEVPNGVEAVVLDNTTDAVARTGAGNHYPYRNNGLVTNATEWRTVAYSTNGFDCTVYVEIHNTLVINGFQVAPAGVRLLGKNGNVVWEESSAIAGQGHRNLWCGSDVYKIQIKNVAGSGSAYAWEA